MPNTMSPLFSSKRRGAIASFGMSAVHMILKSGFKMSKASTRWVPRFEVSTLSLKHVHFVDNVLLYIVLL